MQKTEKQEMKNQPEKKFRSGPICATVWKNQAEKDKKVFEYRTVSFDRNYQNSKGEWATTNSLRANDLPRAILVLQKSFEYIALKDDSSEELIL